MLELNLQGRNRFVLLTRRHAVKLPSLRCWRDFLFGLLNNMNEAATSRSGKPGCCPVRLAIPGGFAIVMPRVRTLSAAEFGRFDAPSWCERNGVSAEPKPDSFGWLGGEIVAVDYGW